MFLVIDGSALMCVAYYGNLPLEVKQAKTEEEKSQYYHLVEQNNAGVYTNGIKGFLNTLMEIIEQQNPEYIAVCFDASRSTTFRRRLFPDYKGQRGETPDPLKRQMANIKTILKNVGIPILESEEYEADDYAGSIIRQFEGTDMPVRSNDTKGWILVGSEAKIDELSQKYGYQSLAKVPYGCYEYDENVLYNEYGLTPSQIPDWKGLSGDASDNIPGIKGVADKSAIPLLQHYGSFESIYADVNACETEADEENLKQKWKEELGIKRPPGSAFRDYKMQGYLSKYLAEIKTDLPVGEPEYYKSNINFEKLQALATRLELCDLANRIEAYTRGEELEMCV